MPAYQSIQFQDNVWSWLVLSFINLNAQEVGFLFENQEFSYCLLEMTGEILTTDFFFTPEQMIELKK